MTSAPPGGSGRCGSGRCGSGRGGSGRCGSGRGGSGRCGSERCGSGRCGRGRCGRGRGGSGIAAPFRFRKPSGSHVQFVGSNSWPLRACQALHTYHQTVLLQRLAWLLVVQIWVFDRYDIFGYSFRFGLPIIELPQQFDNFATN
ncbi:hypothetical protein BV898_07793 [Hypsibius exemplaris]|uniref:Uncharacterized protein n=1 Tax=Hypsibius exemplaris TaxID=2072580 RepID=A0A1W0WSN4_HYPEX|nr:hypothetical protein BV898_07793 [Hypsibius exemplaris]